MDNYKRKKEKAISDEVTKRLISVAGICKGGPKDLADKHDKYIYGISNKFFRPFINKE